MNSRLRTFFGAGAAAGAASATGEAVSVRPSGVSGWREMLIPANLARRQGLVSCRSAGGLFQEFVGRSEQGRRHFDADRFRGLKIDHQFELDRLFDRQIGRLRALENLVDI